MFTKENFQKEWLQEKVKASRENKAIADPVFVEKTVFALYLLELLSKSPLDFIFKGGTALILLLNEPSRLSIDIDILMNIKLDNNDLVTELKKITSEAGPFTRFEEDIREESGIPKRHFKFYYESNQELTFSHYVLLDILFEESTYTDTVWLPVKNNLVSTMDPYQNVHLPSIPAIMGDKMTAFAPNTIGISYGVEKETEIIKQMFDVAILSNEIDSSDLPIIKANFEKCALQNIAFRCLTDVKPDDVLRDIINTSIILMMYGKIEKEKFRDLNNGVNRLKGYIYIEKYSYEKAVRDSGKVAHVAIALLNNDTELKEFTEQHEELGEIQPIFQKRMNVLEKIDKEAYFHWGCVLMYLSTEKYPLF